MNPLFQTFQQLQAIGSLAVLADGLAQAQPPRAAAPRAAAHSRVSHPAPRGVYHPASATTAPLHAGAATAVTAHAPAMAAFRVTPLAARTNTAAAAFRSAVRRRGPVNVALGGPATFDARKLVRR